MHFNPDCRCPACVETDCPRPGCRQRVTLAEIERHGGICHECFTEDCVDAWDAKVASEVRGAA